MKQISLVFPRIFPVLLQRSILLKIMSNDIYAEILTLTYFPIIPLSTTTGYSIYSTNSSTTSCTTNSRSVSWALFGVQAHVPEIKIFTKTRFSNHLERGRRGGGPYCRGSCGQGAQDHRPQPLSSHL